MKKYYEVEYGDDPTGRCVGCYFLKIDYENCPNAPFCQGHEKPIIDIKYVSIDELKGYKMKEKNNKCKTCQDIENAYDEISDLKLEIVSLKDLIKRMRTEIGELLELSGFTSTRDLKEHMKIFKLVQERKNSQSISFEKVKEKLKL